MSPATEPWYVSAFRSDYRTVYPHRDLESARDEVRALARVGLRGRVLDLCCGFGRHTLALAEEGFDVFGLDLSADLLESAAELSGAERLRGRLVRADAMRVPFADASFDGIVNLFSSFGYFGEAGDLRVLDEIARLVRSGGRVVLDLMNPDRIRARLVPESTTERDGLVLRERRSLGEGGRRVTKEVTLTLPDGATKSWREDVRMYATAELEPLLAARGLAIDDVSGAFEATPFGPDAERQVITLSRT
ncbi:MAG: class I SAM-dependent methyltransferase [bacterium]|nr:class I SAM-dependent methyltransferase [bacterium]